MKRLIRTILVLMGPMIGTRAAEYTVTETADQTDPTYPGYRITEVASPGTTLASGDTVTVNLDTGGGGGFWQFILVTFATPNYPATIPEFIVYSSDDVLDMSEIYVDGQTSYWGRIFHRPMVNQAMYIARYSDDPGYSGRVSGNLTLKLKGITPQWTVSVQGFYRVPSEDDLAAPTVTLDSPDVPFDEETRDAAVLAGDTITMRATPGAGTISRVEFYDNEVHVGDGSYDAGSGKWLYTLSNLDPGRHFLRARPIDAQGRSSFSAELLLDVRWFQARVSFQPGGSPAPPSGYLIDQGATFAQQEGQIDGGSPTDGRWVWNFGWDRDLPTGQLVANGLDNDVRFDTYARMRASSGYRHKWEMRVPPGRYKVQLVVGDSSYGAERYNLKIEDQAFEVLTVKQPEPRTGWHDERVGGLIDVTDGLLTIEDMGGDRYPKLNFIEVDQISSDNVSGDRLINEYFRGSGNMWIEVIPLTQQRGLAHSSSDAVNRLFGTETRVCYDQEHTGSLVSKGGLKNGDDWWTIPGSNPLGYFGSQLGGSPLYVGQGYSFSVVPLYLDTTTTPQFRIQVYDRKTLDHAGTIGMPIGDINIVDPGNAQWQQRFREGLTKRFEGFDLVTDVALSLDAIEYRTLPSWILTHRASSDKYLYVVESKSWATNNFSKSFSRVATSDLTSLGDPAYSLLYAMGFESSPVLTSDFSKPCFTGRPVPPHYYGESIQEIAAKSVAALTSSSTTLAFGQTTDLKDITDIGDTRLDPFKKIGDPDVSPGAGDAWEQSPGTPELRRHTLLTEFIEKRRRDPLALVNFVFNEIELSDAISYNQGYDDDPAIDLGGVQRSALGTFLERQGSPMEQCALLVYFLRSAGIPAGYVSTTRNNLLMDSAVVGRMLRVNIGRYQNVPGLVPLNYPWVVALIDPDGPGGNPGRWVHLFPWIKDTKTTEGFDLYGRMPEAYNNAWKWVYQYFQGNPEVLPFQIVEKRLDLTQPVIKRVYGNSEIPGQVEAPLPPEYGDVEGMADFDQPAVLWPRFVQWKLRESGSNVGLEDMGIRSLNRSRYYSRWEDCPTPTQVGGDFKVIAALNEIPRVFDVIRYEITGNTGTLIDSKELQVCDIVNRKMYAEHYNDDVRLTMAPYDALSGTVSATHTWALRDPLDFGQGYDRFVSTVEDPGGILDVRITHKRHRNNTSIRNTAKYWWWTDFIDFYGDSLWAAYKNSYFEQNTLVQGLEYSDSNELEKGIYSLCVNVGRVTKEMLNAHLYELRAFEEAHKDHISSGDSWTPLPEDWDVLRGTKTYLMGMSYWEYMSRYKRQLADLHKVVEASDYGHLFAGLDYREEFSAPVLPKIDIYRSSTFGYLYNASPQPRIRRPAEDVAQDYNHLVGCQGSAYEHGVINKYYGQLGAISTMRLFHLAKDRGHQLVEIRQDNWENWVTTYGNRMVGHDVAGVPPAHISSVPFFSSKIEEYFTDWDYASYPFRRLYLTPSFYKYYDQGAVRLVSLGLAPIPSVGRMGGLIYDEFAGYSLNLQWTEGGSVSVDPGSTRYFNNQSVTLRATPVSQHWKFDHWGGDASGTNDTVTVIMNASKSVTAYFVRKSYTVTLQVNPSGVGGIIVDGSGPYSGGSLTVPSEAVIEVEAVVASGQKDYYAFTGWSGSISGTDNPKNLTVNGNRSITANFSRRLPPVAGLRNMNGLDAAYGAAIQARAPDSQAGIPAGFEFTNSEIAGAVIRYGRVTNPTAPQDEWEVTAWTALVSSFEPGYWYNTPINTSVHPPRGTLPRGVWYGVKIGKTGWPDSVLKFVETWD